MVLKFLASRVSSDGNGSLDELKKEDVNDSSLHSYHMWLKERQSATEGNKANENILVKEDEDDDSGEENFRVDAVLERGPSPPESENSNSYEWSYEEQFKQVSFSDFYISMQQVKSGNILTSYRN